MNKIILITATYPCADRILYIKRCVSVFKKLKNILWIVIEDDYDKNEYVQNILSESGIDHIYFNYGTATLWGNPQKNKALEFIVDNNIEGICYSADHDNFWDVRLFDEIRKTKRVSIFPVGNLGENNIERPIVKKGKIVEWDAWWKARKFPVDWGGISFHTDILKTLKRPYLDVDVKGCETNFLERFVKNQNELEILCNECNDCWTWHNEPLEKNKK